MSYRLQIVNKEGYLLVTAPYGSLGLNAVKRLINVMAEACRKKGPVKVLLDWQPITSEFSISDRLEIGVYAAGTLPRTTKLAVLLREDQLLPERFLEMAVANRDLNLKGFVDSREAIQWLESAEREVAS